MKMIFLILLYVTAIVSAKKAPPYSLRDGPEHFENFIDAHKKIYRSDEEKAMRYEIFLKNLEEINRLNVEHNHTEFGITSFTDLTSEEFVEIHTCFIVPSDYFGSCGSRATPEIKNKYEGLGAPAQFDWRTRNVVSRVKSQGQCGACWAFSVVGNVESINAIKTGQLVELSEQQLVDCDRSDFGCQGGFPEHALQYFISNGAMSSGSYPYEGRGNTCRYQTNKVSVRVRDCVRVQGGSEDSIAEHLVSIGPLSIVLDATPLRHYNGGVLSGQNCQAGTPNHAVLLVGYGQDSASGLQYWLVKNSWDQRWGEQGYFRMQRGVNCLGFSGSYPPVSAVV